MAARAVCAQVVVEILEQLGLGGFRIKVRHRWQSVTYPPFLHPLP
jgi:hypothetical protein